MLYEPASLERFYFALSQPDTPFSIKKTFIDSAQNQQCQQTQAPVPQINASAEQSIGIAAIVTVNGKKHRICGRQ
jgi:hypothetical protein